MSAIQITITDAGRAEIINAANTGTGPVEITEVGLGTGKYAPDPTQTGLVSEIKRLSTIAGQVVSDDTIHVTVKDESADEYDVSEFGLYTDSGTLFAVYSQASGNFMQKAAQSSLLLSVDVILGTLDATNLTFGDTGFSNPPASETVAGVVELATADEVQAGADNSRAVTPAGLASRTATETRAGIVELATDAETQAGTDATRAVTPSSLFAVAVAAATANRIVRRDAAGRAQVAAPIAAADIARKAETDAVQENLNIHRTSGDHDGRYAIRSNNLSDLSSSATARNNLGLGTAATANLTTSDTDTTAGRVLKVGDYGIGKLNHAVSNGDWNELPTQYPRSGFVGFITNTGWLNGPPKSNYYYCQQLFYISGNVTQIAYPYRVIYDGLFIRSRYNGTWSSWVEIYHSGNLGVATESSAGIVELATAAEAQALASAAVALTPARLADAFKGANQSLSGNGYQKLPGGLIMQWGRKAIGDIGTDYYGSTTFPFTFPNNIFQVNATLYSYAGGAFDASVAVTGHSLTGFNFTIQEWSGGVQNLEVSYIAIGD